MKIFVGLDMDGNIWIVDKREMMPEKMMRLQEMNIPARGWKREMNIILGGKKIK